MTTSRSEMKSRERTIGVAAHRAALVFREELWHWGHEPDSPSEGEIAFTLAEFVRHLEESDSTVIRSGRLLAYKGDDQLLLCLELGSLDDF